MTPKLSAYANRRGNVLMCNGKVFSGKKYRSRIATMGTVLNSHVGPMQSGNTQNIHAG
jgi:hypothetical protein